MSRSIRFPTMWSVRPAKPQISLRLRAGWSEPLQVASMNVRLLTEHHLELLYVHSCIAIILMGKRELIALLNLSSWCLLMVERLFLAVPRVVCDCGISWSYSLTISKLKRRLHRLVWVHTCQNTTLLETTAHIETPQP